MLRDTAGSCSHYQNVSQYKLEPSGLPSCIHRNLFGYEVYYSKSLVANKRRIADLSVNIRNQSLYFANSAELGYVPNSLLQHCLLEDTKVLESIDQYSSVKSTVLGLSYKDKQCVVYASGECQDCMTVRDCSGLLTDDSRSSSYSLSVSGGHPLHQISSVGSTYSLYTSPHILSRTPYELFHSRLIDTANTATSNPSSDCQLIVEPIQRWKLPGEVADMSTSSSSSWGFASLLCTNGLLFQWSVTEGLSCAAGGKSVVRGLDSESLHYTSSSNKLLSLRVECSLHPMVSYIVYNEHLLLYDAREPGRAHDMYEVAGICGSGGVIKAVKQLSSDNNKLMMSAGSYATMMDVRHMRTSLAKKPVSGSHSLMKLVNNDQSADVILGSSEYSTHILSHSIDRRLGGEGSALLATASVFGSYECGSCSGWEVTSFPVVDISSGLSHYVEGRSSGLSSDYNVTDSVTLTGFDCVLCGGGGGESLLVHQNSIGDVYAQQVQWMKAPEPSNITVSKRKGAHTVASSAAVAPVSPSADLRSVIGSFGGARRMRTRSSQFLDDSDDSSEHNDTSKVNRNRVNVSRGVASSSSNNNSRRNVETVRGEGSFQNNLPCGVRCFDISDVNDNSTTIRDSRLLKYPVSSSCFPKYQKKQTLLSFDVIQFHPSTISADFSSNSSTTSRPMPLTDSDAVEEHLIQSTQLMETIVDLVSDHPLTLSELFKLVAASTGKLVAVGALRSFLTSSVIKSEMRESVVRAPSRSNFEVGGDLPISSRRFSCDCYRSTARSGSTVCNDVCCVAPYMTVFKRNYSGNSSNSSGVVYRSNKVVTVQSPAVDLNEEDLFPPTQTNFNNDNNNVTASPLAAAIGFSQFSHQSILRDSQLTATSSEPLPGKKGKPSLSAAVISSLSKSWDSVVL